MGAWIPDYWFGNVCLWREENPRTWRKTLGTRTRTNNQLFPHMTPSLGIEPGPHWWEASALTTVPSMLPGQHNILLINILNFILSFYLIVTRLNFCNFRDFQKIAKLKTRQNLFLTFFVLLKTYFLSKSWKKWSPLKYIPVPFLWNQVATKISNNKAIFFCCLTDDYVFIWYLLRLLLVNLPIIYNLANQKFKTLDQSSWNNNHLPVEIIKEAQ